MTERTYYLSELKAKRWQSLELHQSKVTGYAEHPTFDGLYRHVKGLTYTEHQGTKFETFAWTPTLFSPSEKVYGRGAEARPVEGLWRNGEYAAPTVSVFYGDVDNNDESLPKVLMEDVEYKLEELGVGFFLYPSYNHDEDTKHKFRVVIDTDRDLTWEEAFWLFAVLNVEVFGGQGDASIYDQGDHLYAPTARYGCGQFFPGDPLAVDEVLARVGGLEAAYRNRLARGRGAAERRKAGRALTPEEHQRVQALMADDSVRGWVTIKNRAIWSATWNDAYRNAEVNGSHWETMRSLLGRVWRKSGGSLTAGEMVRVFQEIDATADGYWMRHHGVEKLEALLDYIMSLPVEPDFLPVAEAAPDAEEPDEAAEGEAGGTALASPQTPRQPPLVRIFAFEKLCGRRMTQWLRGEWPTDKLLKPVAKLKTTDKDRYEAVITQLLALKPGEATLKEELNDL